MYINHRLLRFCIALVCLWQVQQLLLQAATPADTVIRGTVYNIFHEEFATDADFFAQVDKDLPAIAAAHLSHVMLFPMSQWDTATKTLRWERTDYLIRKIEALHLKFVPLMLKEEQCSHYFPIWKFRELGLWDRVNLNNGSPNNRENVDFADPAVYPLVEYYFKAVAGRYGKSPALAFYNIWNEPHYSSTAPHVVDAFRAWLRAKYRSLDGLNRAWGDDYTDWSDVSPFLNDDWNSSLPNIDWNQFRLEFNGVLLGKLTATLHKFDNTHPVNANPVGTSFASFANFGGYNTDNWQFTAHNDFNGASYYPDSWAREKGVAEAPLWFHNLSFNTFRCAAADKGYILTELYTHAKSGLTLGGYLEPDTARQLAWTALANDCKGILYWKWQPFFRGRQSLGRGLVGVDGELAPRGEAVRDFSHVVGRHESLIANAHPVPAEVALLIDLNGLLKVQLQTGEPRVQPFMYQSIAGAFRSFDDANIPVDFVRTDLPLTAATLSRYKLLVLPFQIVLRRDVYPLLRDYVRSGGTLIADARTATSDELDYAYTPENEGTLSEFLGVRRKEWTGQNSTFALTASSFKGAPFNVTGLYFQETLLPFPDTRVHARFNASGTPALTEHSVGKGTVWYAAFPLGGSAFDHPDSHAAQLLLDLASQSGIAPPALFRSDSASLPMIRVHKNGSETLVYVVSRSTTPLTGSIQLPTTARAARDLITDTPIGATRSQDSLEIPVTLPPRGCLLLHLTP